MTRENMRVARLVIAGVIAVSPWRTASADTLPLRAERVADYRISVALDPGTHELQGRERVVWRNTSDDEVSDLWFHLYLNAFKNNRSTFFRESGGQLRGARADADGWGWIDVTSIRLADGQDLMPGAVFMQPDDGNVDDRTVWRVPLPASVRPGSTLALDVEFRAKLPKVFARTGYHRNFHLVGQWFPKLGVYEPAGRRGRLTGGWNCHQFHATSEFYADFGDYVVDITVPSGFLVGATGVRTSTHENADQTVTYQYEQGSVHDFAWTVDTRFVEIRRTFSGTRDVTADEYAAFGQRLGRTREEMQLGDVEVVFLMQPEHMPQIERFAKAVMLALKEYGLRYGRYPHRTLTVVDPPDGGEGAGGMEYPTFVTSVTSAILGYWPFNRILVPESTIVHEVGHQYWQGMVASNEFEEAWLDEGINTYSETTVMEAGYGTEGSFGRFLGVSLGSLEMLRLENGPWRVFDAIKSVTWRYSSQDAWAFNSYAKPALVLRSLGALVGTQTLDRIMRTYQERWRYRHPATEDFYAVANDVAGHDLRPYFLQTIESGDVLDYEVSEIRSRRDQLTRGYVETASGRELQTPPRRPREREDDPTRLEDPDGRYESTVMVRRRGGVRLPVVLEVKFEGQPPERHQWDGEERWHRLTLVRPTRIEWATVDPDKRLVLDVNMANNSRRATADNRTGVVLSARWLFWVQNLVASLGS